MKGNMMLISASYLLFLHLLPSPSSSPLCKALASGEKMMLQDRKQDLLTRVERVSGSGAARGGGGSPSVGGNNVNNNGGSSNNSPRGGGMSNVIPVYTAASAKGRHHHSGAHRSCSFNGFLGNTVLALVLITTTSTTVAYFTQV